MVKDEKLEMMAYYLINRSVENFRATLNTNYLLNYKKLVSLLLIAQCEAYNRYGINLINPDFYMTNNGLYFNNSDESGKPGRDYELLNLKLLVYEDVNTGLYSESAFEPELDNNTKFILQNVLNRFGYVSDRNFHNFFKDSVEPINVSGVKKLNKNDLQIPFDGTSIISEEVKMSL